MGEHRAYEEIVEFIASGPSSEDVAAFRPSETVRERIAHLIAREKRSRLTAEETSELDHFLQIEHLMRLAKARARRHVVS